MADRSQDLSPATWRKSSYSSSQGQNCVEISTNLPGIVAVRDSKHPDGPSLIITFAQWRGFIRRVQSGAI
jgi:hypothetical protein